MVCGRMAYICRRVSMLTNRPSSTLRIRSPAQGTIRYPPPPRTASQREPQLWTEVCMTSYRGRHAALYDIFYADKPYAAEADFVKSRFERFNVPPGAEAIDIACGTGRHAIALAAYGYRVTGVDHSEDMLACARDSAANAAAPIEFHLRDMRNIDLPTRRFQAATCLFDSIGYVATTPEVLQALGSIYEHLDPDGILVLEYWHAAAMLRGYEPVRVRRWRMPETTVERISETRLRPFEQLADVQYTIHELRDDGTYV